ncbi:helix-turn-helix domain-containing protein [Salininema proteolyticum]|uniref:Helix-turn-helix domain-containing protein n=1 Tax=Salininema proteolyticum TaxID=1607685 RepID=A0ABV8TYH6_9ACTN
MRPDLITACRDRVLKSREKAVLLILATFADEGATTPRLLVTTLAELSGFSKRTVQRALNGLADEGLVQRHSAYRRPNSFTISVDTLSMSAQAVLPTEETRVQPRTVPERVSTALQAAERAWVPGIVRAAGPRSSLAAEAIPRPASGRERENEPNAASLLESVGKPAPTAGPLREAAPKPARVPETAPAPETAAGADSGEKPNSATVPDSATAPEPEREPVPEAEPKAESGPEVEVDEGALAEALHTVGEFWEIHGRGRRFIRDHVARLVAAGWDSDSICRWLGPRTEDVRNPFGVIKHRLDRLRNLEPPFKDGRLPQRRFRCWTCNTPTDNDTRYCDVCTAEQAKPRTKNRSWRDIADEEGTSIPDPRRQNGSAPDDR